MSWSPPRGSAAVGVGLVLAGCGQAPAAGLSVDLPAGPVRSEGRDLAFSGLVRPAGVTVVLRGADGFVAQRPDGHFTVRLLALRPGRSTLTLAAPGARPLRLRVQRGNRLGPPGREPQAGARDSFGSPGALDPTGGQVDLALLGFAAAPARVRVGRGQIVRWHNLDHADHRLVFEGRGGGRPALGRLGYDERGAMTPVRTGPLRYRCSLHPWLRGILIVE